MTDSSWWDAPLRDGEFDVPVMFRVTGSSADAARKTVEQTVERSHGNVGNAIVPMWVPQVPPIVIVIRDPDASNDYKVLDGEAETYDIDLGYADLSDRDEFLGWAGSHLSAAEEMRATRPAAAAFIEECVGNQEWPDEFAQLSSEQLLELARREGQA